MLSYTKLSYFSTSVVFKAHICSNGQHVATRPEGCSGKLVGAHSIDPIANCVQFLFTLIIMAITGNIIDTAFSGNPSVINYAMFVAVFSMLTLFYAIAICFKEEMTFHKLVPSVLDLLNAVFFFCLGVALAAELGAHNCNNAVSSLNALSRTASDTSNRLTHAQITSQTVLATPRPDAKCRRQLLLSRGSTGPCTWSQLSCRSQVAVPT